MCKKISKFCRQDLGQEEVKVGQFAKFQTPYLPQMGGDSPQSKFVFSGSGGLQHAMVR